MLRRSARGLLCAFLFCSASARADDWPQWLGPKRDGVWRETGIVEKFPKGGPKERWRVPIGGGYAGPAVAGGRVYVTDRLLGDGIKNPDNPFARDAVQGSERVLCLDEATGKVVWSHKYPCNYRIAYPAGPRTTPVVVGKKVWTLGAMGDLLCLDTESGKVHWLKNFPKDFGAPVPLWGFSSNPLLDGERLICLVGGKDGAAVVAFDKDSGKEVWRSLSLENTELGYSPPMIFEAGGVRQLIIWTPEAVHSLDPASGKAYWSQRFLVKANLTAPTPRLDGDLLMVTSFYNGSMVLKLDRTKPAASVVWRSSSRGELPDATRDLSAIMCTPVIKDGHVYGVCSYGELRCLKLESGERVWMTLEVTGKQTKPVERWANAFIVPQGDRYFLFNEKGDLIIARLTPQGYTEIDRAHIIEPTGMVGSPRRKVVWSHPAFANRSVYVRNDREIVCVSLAGQ